jgi:hypothetical protein
LSPFVGMPGGMEDSINRYRPVGEVVKNRVRKSAHEPAPIFITNLRMQFGRADNGLNTSVHATEEIFAQPASAILVPAVRVGYVSFSFRRND